MLEPGKNVVFYFMESKSMCGGPPAGSAMCAETGGQPGARQGKEES